MVSFIRPLALELLEPRYAPAGDLFSLALLPDVDVQEDFSWQRWDAEPAAVAESTGDCLIDRVLSDHDDANEIDFFWNDPNVEAALSDYCATNYGLVGV